jgi:hypothetical protein
MLLMPAGTALLVQGGPLTTDARPLLIAPGGSLF